MFQCCNHVSLPWSRISHISPTFCCPASVPNLPFCIACSFLAVHNQVDLWTSLRFFAVDWDIPWLKLVRLHKSANRDINRHNWRFRNITSNAPIKNWPPQSHRRVGVSCYRRKCILQCSVEPSPPEQISFWLPYFFRSHLFHLFFSSTHWDRTQQRRGTLEKKI